MKKCRLVDVLTLSALAIFAVKLIGVVPVIEQIQNNPHAGNVDTLFAVALSVVSAIYTPLVLLGLAKIILLLEEKNRNAQN